MGNLLTIRAETNLDEFDSLVPGDGDIYWAAAAALASTSGGIATLIDDTTDTYGLVAITMATSATDIRVRIYYDPNSLTIPNYENYIIFLLRANGSPTRYQVQFGIYFNDTDYQVRALCLDDAGDPEYTAYYTISDGPHYLEAHLERSASVSSNDGELSFWIDRALQETVTGIDTYAQWERTNYDVYAGAVDGIPASTAGTFYIDEIIVNDDAAEIGPYVPPAAGALPMAMHHYRQLRS